MANTRPRQGTITHHTSRGLYAANKFWFEVEIGGRWRAYPSDEAPDYFDKRAERDKAMRAAQAVAVAQKGKQ